MRPEQPPAEGDVGDGTAATPAAAPRAPSPDLVEPDLEAEELDAPAEDLVDGDAEEADDDQVEDEPARGRKELPERTCGCGRRFQPTHPLQKKCPRCRGCRVTSEASKSEPSDSWWTKATSREDFQKRAAEREETMRKDPEARKIRTQILGERTT